MERLRCWNCVGNGIVHYPGRNVEKCEHCNGTGVKLYAVLVRCDGKWITHEVFDNPMDAHSTIGSLVYLEKRFSLEDACVRVYHSREWEGLVR